MSSYTRETDGDQIASDLSSTIKGKSILITGVSPGGLGAEFAITISKHFPRLLILAGRDVKKAEQTAAKIAEVAPTVEVRTLKLDLASQSQVREAAQEVNAYKEPGYIDVLVNNAGIMATMPYTQTVERIESQFGTNHIGHFLFTNLIMEKLIGADGSARTARVVNVSSDGYRLGHVRFDDWNFDNGTTYNPWRAYGQSKTANMLFSRSLAAKLADRGLISVSLHPGVILDTNLSGHLDASGFQGLLEVDRQQGNRKYWGPFKGKTPLQGVSTHVFASFHDSIMLTNNNGVYLEDNRVFRPEEVLTWGRDDIEAQKLWKLSEELVGEKFLY
ncbi:short-chain dehydrogenase, putative [Talaromyces stipitatus ATCC 10500]|uniref:Short-chain dehydrogenase, putative n=1 Tax=Talaromyces stipitatus (strain ATCC 10500 / CBS 375.48 / QM 6759 / NRRL 1006) TaxID=441959 RepID=B8MQA5_TALSN|nr:short-chain dehydrogenase, putative [Talaromyces stipitatus ATCC 10500]EED13252.1 short-chain dehydrogenase, putative [Talaromyces stipitatus ATCC 10500]